MRVERDEKSGASRDIRQGGRGVVGCGERGAQYSYGGLYFFTFFGLFIGGTKTSQRSSVAGGQYFTAISL